MVVGLMIAGCGGGEDAPPPPASQPADPAPVAQQPTAAAGAPAGALPAGMTQENVEQGRQLFTGQGICFTCHGQEGQGTALAPALNDNDWIWIDTSGDVFEQLVALIGTGVTQPRDHPAPMPPAGGGNLSDEQLRSLAAYVYTLAPR